jgi:hypothetical protein
MYATCIVQYSTPIPYASHDIPNGFRTFSLATLAATSPPFCNAIAPIMAYVVWAKINSRPEWLRWCSCSLSILVFNMQTEILTSLGVHRIISCMPFAFASPASLVFDKTSASGTSDKFAKPSNAGCVKGVRSSDVSGNDWVFVAVGECSNARFV